jgi:uncharacterized protein DUF4386
MTLRSNARLCGATYLLYIVTGIGSMILMNRIGGGGDVTAMLASIAQHATLYRAISLLVWLQFLYAVVLGVTLYALTRDQDRDLAVIAMCCRLVEGAMAAVSTSQRFEILSLARASATAGTGADAAAAHALGTLMLGTDGGGVAALCFSVAAMIFSYLFLRARSIPTWLAWLGVVSSALWLIGMPARMLGFLHGAAVYVMWIPMGIFEITLAVLLLVKGVTASSGGTPVPAAA